MSTPQLVPSAALPTLRFVAAQPQHHAAIAALITTPEELFLVHPAGHFPWDDAQIAGLAASREQLTVGLLEDEVVAFANLYQVQPGVSAFIGNVIVAEAAKGRGIGQALVAHMVTLCRQKLAAEPRLSVFSANSRALLLYSKLGFVPYGVEPRQDWHGNTLALIHMRHSLPDAVDAGI